MTFHFIFCIIIITIYNDKCERQSDMKRYGRLKERTTVAISPDVHTALKMYAQSRELLLEDAVEELLKLALAIEIRKSGGIKPSSV